MSIAPGARFDRYEILSLLGKGGMGEVYLAQDTRLKRKLALKLLPAEFTQDAERVGRFEQEAQAASALNHPNIITVYEIGEVEGTHFMATEFVDGQTLRERMTQSPLTLREALDVAVQIASALAETHGAGITHRDIKPENVMVRPNGLVKVLDFGLAKLTEKQAHTGDTDTPTSAGTKTDPGTVMGTVQYMSPEQARGEKIDARTDIFSFGVVLYEMIAGIGPFTGATTAEVFAAILKTEPPPLAHRAPAVPTELERIVAKALRKDREQRYQTIKDLLIDLSDLKHRLEFEAQLERTGQTEARDKAAKSSGEASTAVADGAPTGGAAAVPTTSSAKIIVGEIKRHQLGVVMVLAALVIAGVGVAYWLSQLSGRSKSAASSQAMKIKKLTDTGKAGSAAISPDGKYVVHVKEDAGQQSLWVRHIATGSNVQIIPPAAVEFGRMTFSPDGGYIYFGRREKGEPNYGLFRVPVLGGESKKLNSNAGSPVTFSPDGKRIAFVRNHTDESTMMIANSDGTGEQPLATLKSPESFKSSGPGWSPDGKVIASSTKASDEGGNYGRIVEIRVEDGSIKQIGSSRWADAGQVAWLADSSGVIMSNFERDSNIAQVFQISYPGGEVRKITNDLLSYHGVSLTADSGSMVVVQEDRVYNVWSTQDGDTSRPKQLTRGSAKWEGRGGLRWTPDGKIVYLLTSGGLNPHVWIMNGDGSDPRQLTQVNGASPAVSPDGRYVVYSSPSKPGTTDIWRTDIDGGNPKQLTNTEGGFPSISPDGRWVIYSKSVSGVVSLWKVSIDGGDPVRLTEYFSGLGVVSPDGKSIASLYREQTSSPFKIAIIPFEGGQPTKVLDLPPGYNTVQLTTGIPQGPHWMPDGRSLAYIVTRDGVSNIWSMPLAGGAPKQLTNFTSDQIAWFDLSRDGKPTLFSRGATTKDVILISGFK